MITLELIQTNGESIFFDCQDKATFVKVVDISTTRTIKCHTPISLYRQYVKSESEKKAIELTIHEFPDPVKAETEILFYRLSEEKRINQLRKTIVPVIDLVYPNKTKITQAINIIMKLTDASLEQVKEAVDLEWNNRNNS